MTVVTPTDHPKLVRNRCVIEVFGGVFALFINLKLFFGIGVFVKGLSQIFFFFSLLEELFSETAVGCTASYFVKIIWCSCWFCKHPPFWGWILLICGRRRVAVARYRMICLVLDKQFMCHCAYCNRKILFQILPVLIHQQHLIWNRLPWYALTHHQRLTR